MYTSILSRHGRVGSKSQTKRSVLSKRNQRLSRAVGGLEALESRQMLSLLGVAPGFPNIFYDTTGKINYTYNTTTSQGDFALTATPHFVTFNPADPPAPVFADPGNGVINSFTINFLVNSDGTVAAGQSGPNLIVSGKVTNPITSQVYDGILLEGDIQQFGYQYTGTTSNNFDFTFNVDPNTPGLLAPMYAGQSIGVTTLSLGNTFVGDFTQNFVGGANNGAGANGNLGPIPPVQSLPPGSLSGMVFEDLYETGIFQSTDVLLPNVQVTLTGTDENGNPVDVVTTTDLSGTYDFTDLTPSNSSGYTITLDQATVPSPLTEGLQNLGSLGGISSPDVFSNIVVGPGQNGSFYDFGENPPASISGYVYLDYNNDGIQESGEPGIGGVTITLTGTNDLGQAVDDTTTTLTAPDLMGDQVGYYQFANLLPSELGTNYTVTETHPAGYIDGKDTFGTGWVNATQSQDVLNEATPYPLISAYPPPAVGAVATQYNFGELLPGSLSGTVYEDLNDNGVLVPTDVLLPNVQVTLTGTDDNGNPVDVVTTTNSSGGYSFTGLAPSNSAGYTITESQATVPSPLLEGKDTLGTLGGNASVQDVFSGIQLSYFQNGTSYNFGEIPPASISGYVYYDANDDGIKESGEPGIGGVTITLTGTNDLGQSVDLTTTTSTSSATLGYYQFTNLRPAETGTEYAVTETHPAGYIDAKDTFGAGWTNATQSQDVLNEAPPFPLVSAYPPPAAGAVGVNYNFGEILPSTIAGTVYYDANADDKLDTGDTGLAGITVTLTGTSDIGPVTLTTTTASNGTYSFTGLRPGTYTLTETQPSGYTAELSNPGSLGGTTAIAVIGTIPIASNQAGVSYNFPEIFSDVISGTVYLDSTGEGLGAGELPLAGDTPMSGVVVDLYKDVSGTGVLSSADGAPIAAVTVGSSGFYQFTDLAPGHYITSEVVPTGYVQTGPYSPNYYPVSVVNGSDIIDLNFSNYKPCTIANMTVCYTLNNNGCKTTVPILTGNTQECETVTVTFTIPAGTSAMQYTLVSYNAPDPTYVATHAYEQTIYQQATGTFGPGTHTLTVTIPCNYYQIDFICGPALTQFGPVGSNIFYGTEDRLISYDNGGTNSDVVGLSASMLFWSSTSGQKLIDAFGGSSTSTALGTWLASTYPNIFGGTLLGAKTNALVAAKFLAYYGVSGQKNQAQVMATALNIYASTLSLGGTTAAAYGFTPTAAGLGAAVFNIGSNGAAFGVSNNTNLTVSQMLSDINSKSSGDVLLGSNTTLLNDAYNELNLVNTYGGIV